jgi:hypothetical protein
MVRINTMSSWIDRFVRRTQGITRPPPRVFQNLRILILLESAASNDSVKFCQYIINNGFVNKNIDVYQSNIVEEKSYSQLMQRFYNRGYRLVIGVHNSALFQSFFDWLNRNQDFIYVNCSSTVATDSFIENIPSNSFRTNIDDLYALNILFNDILPNFKYALVPIGDTELYAPLENTVAESMPFKYIVYIYEPSLYTLGYKTNIEQILKTYTKGSVVFVPIELDPSSNILPDDAIYYLTFNNASKREYMDSTEKPLIIINSLTPQTLLNRFTDSRYYDNYTITGDTFEFGPFITQFKFHYAFSIVSNFSHIGFKLSYFIDKTQSISPSTLAIYNICSVLGPIFSDHISTNRTFIARQFLQKLTNLNYIQNKTWYDKYLTMQHITYEEQQTNNNVITFNLAILKHTWNPETYVVSVSNDNRYDYNKIIFDEPKFTYQQNLLTIENNRPNKFTFLDSKMDFFNDENDFKKYTDFLSTNYVRDLPLSEFAKYYCFNKTEKYDIPIIDITFPIDAYVSQNVYNIENVVNNIETEIPVTIPSTIFQPHSIERDLDNPDHINFMGKTDMEKITVPSFTINLTDAIPVLYLITYNGNELNLFKHSENISGNEEEDHYLYENIKSYVKWTIPINWLIIKKKYSIGDIVSNVNDDRKATVIEISENYYELGIKYIDDDSIEYVKQKDVNPYGELLNNLLDQPTLPN